jgi:hypothetical protein
MELKLFWKLIQYYHQRSTFGLIQLLPEVRPFCKWSRVVVRNLCLLDPLSTKILLYKIWFFFHFLFVGAAPHFFIVAGQKVSDISLDPVLSPSIFTNVNWCVRFLQKWDNLIVKPLFHISWGSYQRGMYFGVVGLKRGRKIVNFQSQIFALFFSYTVKKTYNIMATQTKIILANFRL